MEDLRYINKVVKKINKKKNLVIFTKIGEREDLEVNVWEKPLTSEKKNQ